MKIAVIGTGISGMVAAWLLHRQHSVTVYEANDYIGGHSNTVDVTSGDRVVSLDTGFVVFNERTYPNFCRLLRRLGVESQESEMSFSVRCERTGLEYCGTSLNTLFAQRRNLFRPKFLRMLVEILQFNRRCVQFLSTDEHNVTLMNYLTGERYSQEFIDHYLIPMGAAIWSTSHRQMFDFPARYFIHFLANHGLITLSDRPIWRTICGGSRRYVNRLTQPFRDRIQLRCPVQSVSRSHQAVEVTSVAGKHTFDHVVIATHGDQALRLLDDASSAEREVLGAFRCSKNLAVLHTDTSMLPRSRRAWASWNYHLPAESVNGPTVTYQLNRLHQLETAEQFCVTLNREPLIAPEKILSRIVYEHPLYSPAAVAAQLRHSEISGHAFRTHFCGAYWGYGFHEDGVKSALSIVKPFGINGVDE